MIYPPTFYITEQDLDKLRTLSDATTTREKSRIMKFKRTRLREKILEFIALYYSISAPDLTERFPFSKRGKIGYDNAKEYLRNLNKLGLIEVTIQQQKILKKKGNSRQKKYYRLTSKGIYYILSNNRDLPPGVLKAMLDRHDNHILFRLFIYPYIQRSSLLKIIDSFVFSLLCRYLNDCCRNIQEMFRSIDTTYNSKNGYLTDQVCIWNNVSTVEYDTSALRNFLVQKFKWNWLDKASIIKTDNGNGIRVSNGLNTILIILNQEKTKATLSFRGKKLYELIVREIRANKYNDNQSESMLVIYTDEFLIFPDKGFLKIPVIQSYLDTFRRFLQSRIMELIFSFSLVYRTQLLTINVLAHDQNFIKQLDLTKVHFDRLCSFFSTGD
jgi:DNA-binding PadR family transcriptional regulator